MNLPESRDADFTWKDFQARVNNELAANLGNLVNRTMTFAHKNFGGMVPAVAGLDARRSSGEGSTDEGLARETAKAVRESAELFERYRFRDATLALMNYSRFANKYFNDQEPWKSSKNDPERCALTINLCLQAVRSLAILLEPVLPFTAQRIWSMLNLPSSPSASGWMSATDAGLADGHALGRPEILFTKIEDEVIDRHLQTLPKEAPVAVLPPTHPIKPMIDIDQFKSVDLRVAKVLSAERVVKSTKLLKLKVSIGSEERQVIAGIGQHYQPESLVGKKIVLVSNLAPAKLMGEESQGMLLAASNDEGKLTILTVSEDISEGSIVK
jgi:methionyl-tRNA synthetase